MEKYEIDNDIYEYFTITLHNLIQKDGYKDLLNVLDFGDSNEKLNDIFRETFLNFYWYNEIAFTTPELFKYALKSRFNLRKQYYYDKLKVYQKYNFQSEEIWQGKKIVDMIKSSYDTDYSQKFNQKFEQQFYDLPNVVNLPSERNEKNTNNTSDTSSNTNKNEDYKHERIEDEPYIDHMNEILKSVRDILYDFCKEFKDLFLSVYRIL